MKLYLPVKPKFINQKFGEVANLAYYQANGINFTGHNGIDFAAKHGQPVYAAHDGIAYFETDDKQGHGVVIRSNDTFNYISNGAPYIANYKTIYWHFADPSEYPSPIPTSGVPISVKAGDHIGWADSTGLSTGNHLHLGFKPIAIGEPPEAWYNIAQNNGYMGAVDPAPYLSTEFAQDLPLKHSFNKNILIGELSSEVVYLQRALSFLGFFNHEITGFYGTITMAAVYEFQKKYVALDFWSRAQVLVNQGNAVRSLTQAALNRIFA